jgi:NAD(P)H-dependent FMN reductase
MPGHAPYEHEVVRQWTAAIGRSDGFIIVAPEYNYGPSAVLKNALDWVYPEWNRKAVGFVSYGSALGARRPAAATECHRAATRADPLIGSNSYGDALDPLQWR